MNAACLVNDVHSKLNATRVARQLQPKGLAALIATVRDAHAGGHQLSVCGARHAMGRQQFGTNTQLVDMRAHADIQEFDSERGLITVGAGMQWPELVAGCLMRSSEHGRTWSIRQKQTGADCLTLGGALAANIHGRGLRMPPIVGDVEAFTLIDSRGEVRRCSRATNGDLFRLAIGGYGLFGLIADVTLRLIPRVKLERRVEILSLDELAGMFHRHDEAIPHVESWDRSAPAAVVESRRRGTARAPRLHEGSAMARWPTERDTSDGLFGDFQFSIDECSPDFLQRGVYSVYRRIPDDAPMPPSQKQLKADDWERLMFLAHTDRARGFREYASYYLSTSGQRYWSDTHQLSTYLENYHEALDRRQGARHPGSEMITEIFVPRPALIRFMRAAAEILRDGNTPVIYGTIRLIERDTESFLAWAREPWACVIFNLHVDHTAEGVATARRAFRALIDLAIRWRGSYYLTYHRWATREQVEAGHPRFREFLKLKEAHDPDEVFTSDWYRHYRALFADEISPGPWKRGQLSVVRIISGTPMPPRTCRLEVAG